MLYQDRTKLDFISGVPGTIYYDWKSYGGFGVDVSGTITGGQYLLIQGSIDGNIWTTLFTVDSGINPPTQVTNNQIIATGRYVCNIVAYPQGRIKTSDSFTGTVGLSASMTVDTPSDVAQVLGG